MSMMDPNENALTVLSDDVTQYDDQAIFALAVQAERRVTALNTIMQAAIKITTYLDWVIIGGNPYLQESGASKVARVFGISWKIHEGYPKKELDEGYPSWEYRMTFAMGNNVIEAEGSRSGKDDFFTGRERKKGPDQIDSNDVKKSAYTNCLNNGIKRILPGLRNIDIAALELGGIDSSKVRGYTFKEGEKGGKGKGAEQSGMTCSHCSAAITQQVASFSEAKHKRRLCRACQDLAKAGKLPAEQKPATQTPSPAQKPAAQAPVAQKPADPVPPWEDEYPPGPDDGDAPPSGGAR